MKRAKGDYDGAIADCTKAVELKPDYAGAYNNRGWSEFLKNDYDNAIRDATHAIQLGSKNRYAYGTRGWARYGKSDNAGALEDLKKAIELSGVNSLDQGMIDFINSDYQKAVDSWQKAIQHDASLGRELQPWIEKAKGKLTSAN